MTTPLVKKFFAIIFVLTLGTLAIFPLAMAHNYHLNWLDAFLNYDPLLFFRAVWHHYHYFLLSVTQSFLVSCMFLTGLYFFTLRKVDQNIYGNARFANDKEIAKFKNATSGLVIGQHKGKLLRFPGQQFVCLSAPTRSGKGVGIVIPNLLTQEDSSMVVLDIPKFEAFTITSKYRKEVLGQEIYLFSPFLRGTSRYNPLDYVDFDSDLADIQLNAIASIIYVGANPDDYFLLQARELFVGMAWFTHALIEETIIDEPMSIATILRCSTVVRGQSFENYYKDAKLKVTFPEEATLRLERFLNTSENTRSSIKSSFEIPLAIFGTKIVAENTNSSDFNLNDLRKRKMTIYVGVTLQELLQARVLINLFFSQLLVQNTLTLPEQDKSLKHSCVLLLDEFTSIGQLEILKKGSAFIAGYNLRMLTVFQSKSQVEEPPPAGYGKDGARSLIVNHACEIVYAPKEAEISEEYSKRLGYRDVIDNTLSRHSKDIIHRNINENKQQRALMLPQEIRQLPFDKEIIFIEGSLPILANKAFYFSVPTLVSKLKMVSHSLAGIKKPEKKDFDRAFQNGETKISLKALSKNNFNISKGKR